MIDFKDSTLFTPWHDPESGVVSYLLTKKVAPVQQGFYFVNDCMSEDGRYLWFYCVYPPSGRALGVLDSQCGEVRYLPETQFEGGASPYIDPHSGDATWGMGSSLWRRGPGKDDAVVCVNSLPEDLVGKRKVNRVATHLTRTADGKGFFVDSSFGLQFVFGVLPIDGGDFEMWHRFDRNHNHAQASPIDPDVALFAEENHPDPITGLSFTITDRLWLIRRGEASRPILREPRKVSHEWWDPDGKHVWCVWKHETWRVDIESGEVEVVEFPHHCWHSHSSADGKLVVGDSNNAFYRGCPSAVYFLNRHTGKLIRIMDNPERLDYVGRKYHIDPHPRFCCGDRYIVFTARVRGELDVAIVPTEALVQQTS